MINIHEMKEQLNKAEKELGDLQSKVSSGMATSREMIEYLMVSSSMLERMSHLSRHVTNVLGSQNDDIESITVVEKNNEELLKDLSRLYYEVDSPSGVNSETLRIINGIVSVGNNPTIEIVMNNSDFDYIVPLLTVSCINHELVHILPGYGEIMSHPVRVYPMDGLHAGHRVITINEV